MKAKYARQDAAEMYSILRTANCIKRYDSISHQLLAELVVAIATSGEVVGGNNRGSDVTSPIYGKIEVKSRILGTDGPFPRISLKPHNLEKADWIAAVRWTREFEFHDAVALPRAAAQGLFAGRLTEGRAAHVAWQTWVAAPGADSLADRVQTALKSLS
ncbi:hypothetical protein FJV80_07825 [Mesorhizobium sp. WSM4310]|uniref:hypothetical protein n=1 Tax=Mesorhizobium sp. WSM4310 TaxID=2589883 RepID=UPI00115D62BD|nr:hypothetical protein [Mesorhizobium sp. WSM4310]TRC89692.1 hypothetical protein FJV80_07825 [Mesorhizobium sp. WSM4310]